jgi:hypothetical protein
VLEQEQVLELVQVLALARHRQPSGQKLPIPRLGKYYPVMLITLSFSLFDLLIRF